MRFIYPESKCSSSDIVQVRLHSWPSGSALAVSLTLHDVCFPPAMTCGKILTICSSAINWYESKHDRLQATLLADSSLVFMQGISEKGAISTTLFQINLYKSFSPMTRSNCHRRILWVRRVWLAFNFIELIVEVLLRYRSTYLINRLVTRRLQSLGTRCGMLFEATSPFILDTSVQWLISKVNEISLQSKWSFSVGYMFTCVRFSENLKSCGVYRLELSAFTKGKKKH